MITDHLRVGKELNKRVKIMKLEYPGLKYKRFELGTPVRVLAKEYGVSVDQIYKITNTDDSNQLPTVQNKNWKKYYNKDKAREAMKKHRDYKRSLVDEGLIHEQERD